MDGPGANSPAPKSRAPKKPRPPKAPTAGGGAGGGDGARGGVAKKKRNTKAKAGAAAAVADVGVIDEDAGADEPEAASFRGMFNKDLRLLMYGFGDSEVPVQETVDLVEDILVDYVRETCCSAMAEAGRLGKLERDKASGQLKPKIDEKDIMFLVRKDPKKYTRIRELLEMQMVIKEARKAVDIENVEALAEGGGDEGGGGGAEEDLEDVPGGED